MASSGIFTLGSHVSPAAPAATSTRQDFGLDAQLSVPGDTDTVAQILAQPEDYPGGGVDPWLSFELRDGTDPQSAIPDSGGDAVITWQIIERANGAANDFSLVRGVHVQAAPLDPETASKITAKVTLGPDLSFPLKFDSADTARPALSSALVVIPAGLALVDDQLLTLTISESDNARVLMTLQGK
jgi:hypothetical protein